MRETYSSGKATVELALCALFAVGCAGNRPEDESVGDAEGATAQASSSITDDGNGAVNQEQLDDGVSDLSGSSLPAASFNPSANHNIEPAVKGKFIVASPMLKREYGLSPEVESEVASVMREILQSEVVRNRVMQITLLPEDNNNEFPSVKIDCTNGHSETLELAAFATKIDPSLCTTVDQKSLVLVSKIFEGIGRSSGYEIDNVYGRLDREYVKTIRRGLGFDETITYKGPDGKLLRRWWASPSVAMHFDNYIKKMRISRELRPSHTWNNLTPEKLKKETAEVEDGIDAFSEQPLMQKVQNLLAAYYSTLHAKPGQDGYKPGFFGTVNMLSIMAALVQADEIGSPHIKNSVE